MSSSVLTPVRARHRVFPITAQTTFLAHAAVSPLPAPVTDAMTAAALAMSRRGQFGWVLGEAEDRSRRRAADLLGVSASEIAFTPSTSAGLATVAAGWRLRPGDEVLVVDADFPSIRIAWRQAERRGVIVRIIPRDPAYSLTCEQVMAHVGPRTKVVTVSTAQWLSGSPIEEPCALYAQLHGRGVALVLDAIQSLGVRPVCGEHADAVVADAHKWLLGPQGIGVLMVKADRFGDIDPVIAGWRSVQPGATNAGGYGDGSEPWCDTARRYEAGGLNLIGLVGLEASLGLLEGSRDLVRVRTTALRRHLERRLRDIGATLLGAGDDDWSPMVAFRPRNGDVRAVVDALDDGGVVVSVRAQVNGVEWLRASPHFYNTEEDLDRLVDLVCAR